MTDKHIGELLKEAAGDPELYNEVSRILYKDLGIVGAEACLVCFHIANHYKQMYYDECDEAVSCSECSKRYKCRAYLGD